MADPDEDDDYDDVADDDEDNEQNDEIEETPVNEINNIIANSPRILLLETIEKVIIILHRVTHITCQVYNQMRADILEHCLIPLGPDSDPETVAINRRILVTLINVTRMFNRRILNESVPHRASNKV